jgi:hypothetical protein
VLQQKRRRLRRGLVLKLALAAVSFAGPVSLAQKSAVKDWIDAEAAKINDKGEARQTVNYLTKLLLKSASVTHAELLALAAEVAGRQDMRLSAQAVQLVETLISTKPSSEPVLRPYLEKISQELGLASVAPTVPARTKARPAKPKAKPAAVPRPSANPSVRRALLLNRKLRRTVPAWSSMTPEAKVAHVKSVLLLLQAQMSSRSGLADRNSLQEKIDDHAQLVVLIREGRIEQEGSPEDLYAKPATVFAAQGPRLGMAWKPRARYASGVHAAAAGPAPSRPKQAPEASATVKNASPPMAFMCG